MMLFFWNLIVPHSMITVLPTPEHFLLNSAYLGALVLAEHFSSHVSWEACRPPACQDRSTS